MRPYRGKRIDNGEWVFGYLMMLVTVTKGKRAEVLLIGKDYDHLEEVHPDTVGQSTGRKIGKADVYDGDILKSLHFLSGKNKRYLHHTVYWSERYTSWMTCNQAEKDKLEKERAGSPPLWVYLRNSKEVKITGNIHTKEPK